MRSSICISCRIFSCKTHSTPSTQSTSSQQCAEMHQHRETILETLLESEQGYISVLEDFIVKAIQPLAFTLSTSTQPHLHLDVHHLDELLQFHRFLYHILQDSIKTQHLVGGIFIQLASTLKPIFEAYCYQHAKTLFLLNHNKNRILTTLSEINPSNDNNKAYIQLIKNLSLPLHRLEDYASLLNEYLYNLEEFHIDRADTQQAVEYYAELAYSGAERRKRKEWELDIVHSNIHGITSETLASFGDALCLSHVHILSEHSINQKPLQCIGLLYPTTFILLSTLSNQEEYKIENRFQINRITVSKIIDDHKRALKINAPLNQSLIISFPSSIEYDEWREKFCLLLTTKTPQSHSPQQVSKSSSPLTRNESPPVNPGFLPLQPPPPINLKNPIWSKGCLRPHSPIPSSHAVIHDISTNPNENGSTRALKRFMSMKKSKANEFLKRVETSEGDSLLLSVIEAYCVSTSTSGTAITSLNILPSKTRYSIQGALDHSNVTLSPTTSIDLDRRTMYNMINELRLAYKSLRQKFEEEKRARKQLESQIQRLILLTPGK